MDGKPNSNDGSGSNGRIDRLLKGAAAFEQPGAIRKYVEAIGYAPNGSIDSAENLETLEQVGIGTSRPDRSSERRRDAYESINEERQGFEDAHRQRASPSHDDEKNGEKMASLWRENTSTNLLAPEFTWDSRTLAPLLAGVRLHQGLLLEKMRGYGLVSQWRITKAFSWTALREMEELSAAGVMEQEEAGGRSTSYRIRRTAKIREQG